MPVLRGCWTLCDAVSAGTAGVFWTASYKDTELRKDDIQPLGHILADAMQASAASADQAFRFDDLLDARKMSEQRAAIGGAGFRCGFAEGLSASSSAWMAAMAVSRSSNARSNCSGSAFSDLRPKAACLKAATSFSSRSIRSSLRTSRACAAISMAFSAAMSSGRSAASNMPEVYQTSSRFAERIRRPSHRAASIRWRPAVSPLRNGPDASRGQ